MIDRRTSEFLRALTCVCTLLIAIYHLPFSLVHTGIARATVVFIRNHLGVVAVPLFFAVSGFLLASKTDESRWYWRALKSRFWTLVVPYVCVNTLLIPELYVYHNVFHAGMWPGGGLSLDWPSIGRVYGLIPDSHPAAGPLWYVRCLLMFVVLSPIFVWVIRRAVCCAVLFLIMLTALIAFAESVLIEGVWIPFFYSFFNLRGVLFFCIGIVIALHRGKFTRAHAAAIVGIGTIGALFSCFQDSSMSLWAMVCVAVLISACCYFVQPRFPSWFERSCFVVYAFHEAFYRVYCWAVNRFDLCKFLPDELLIILPFVITICVLCFLKTTLDRKCPALSSFMFGGR